MGSDMYACVEVAVTKYNGRVIDKPVWFPLFRDPDELEPAETNALERGIIVDAFGDCDPDNPLVGKADGYVRPEDTSWSKRPWRRDEPYWIRRIDGAEFVAIVREKRWHKLEYTGECSPELRALAALVEVPTSGARQSRTRLVLALSIRLPCRPPTTPS